MLFRCTLLLFYVVIEIVSFSVVVYYISSWYRGQFPGNIFMDSTETTTEF